MAILRAPIEDDTPPPRGPISLSIRWCSINVDANDPGCLESDIAIGLLLGDTPLLTPTAYEGRPPGRADGIPGHFDGETYDCELLIRLRRLLETGERMDFEDVCYPSFRLVIRPVSRKPDTDADMFDVLAIVHSGGSWHGDLMGYGGPAVSFWVRRKQLETLYAELRQEAVDLCDEKCLELLEAKVG